VTGDRNLFSIGRVRHDEDQLTEMLAWLASAVPEVAGKLVELAFGSDVAAADSADVQISTQYGIAGGRLDALIESPSFVLIVESKLWSGYGGDQLSKYLEWLCDRRDGRACGLMTVTKFEAPWPGDDWAFADREGIARGSRMWEDLYERLLSLTEGAEPADLV